VVPGARGGGGLSLARRRRSPLNLNCAPLVSKLQPLGVLPASESPNKEFRVRIQGKPFLQAVFMRVSTPGDTTGIKAPSGVERRMKRPSTLYDTCHDFMTLVMTHVRSRAATKSKHTHTHINTHVHTYTHTHVCVCACMGEREKERASERERA